MQAVGADELLRVFEHAVAVAVVLGVVHLRIVVGAQGIGGGQFVAADAADADFLGAGLEVEVPAARALDQRDRQGPGLLADAEHRLAAGAGFDRVAFAVPGEEGVDVGAFDTFQRDVVAPVLAEQGRQRGLVGTFGAQRLDQRFGGGVGRREACWAAAGNDSANAAIRASGSEHMKVFTRGLLINGATWRCWGGRDWRCACLPADHAKTANAGPRHGWTGRAARNARDCCGLLAPWNALLLRRLPVCACCWLRAAERACVLLCDCRCCGALLPALRAACVVAARLLLSLVLACARSRAWSRRSGLCTIAPVARSRRASAWARSRAWSRLAVCARRGSRPGRGRGPPGCCAPAYPRRAFPSTRGPVRASVRGWRPRRGTPCGCRHRRGGGCCARDCRGRGKARRRGWRCCGCQLFWLRLIWRLLLMLL